jgi:hypothetical protein
MNQSIEEDQSQMSDFLQFGFCPKESENREMKYQEQRRQEQTQKSREPEIAAAEPEVTRVTRIFATWHAVLLMDRRKYTNHLIQTRQLQP